MIIQLIEIVFALFNIYKRLLGNGMEKIENLLLPKQESKAIALR